MQVLMINPTIRENDNPAFPLGLGYLASVLLKAGHSVEVIDAAAHRLNKHEVLKEIKKRKFDVLAVGGLITLFNYLKWLTDEVRKINSNVKIISGGSAVSSIPKLFIKKTGVDVGLLYESEITVLDVMNSFYNGTPLENIPGIAFRNSNGEIIVTPLRERIKDLDDIPFPAYHLFPMEIYLKYPLELGLKNHSKGRKWIRMIATRGCPWKCTFCHRNFGNTFRTRSPENIIAEMEMLYTKYGITFFNFMDETLTVNRNHTMELCNKLIEKKYDFKWACLTRADLVSKELLQKMKQAGCVYVNFGLESGSQKMLDSVDKKIKVETMEQAVKWVQESDIEVAHSFMIGIPGETKETVQETIDFCRRLSLHPTFFICTPYPGTILWDKLKQDGKITGDDDEEVYIEQLANSGDAINLNMNVSGLPDKELLALRDWATKQMESYYYKTRPIAFLKSRISWIKYATKTLKNIYRTHGSSAMFHTMYNKLSGKKTKIFTTQ